MLFSQEGIKTSITESKIVLTVPGYNTIFPGKSNNKNHPVKIVFTLPGYKGIFKRKSITKSHLVKNKVNGAQVKMPVSQEKKD